MRAVCPTEASEPFPSSSLSSVGLGLVGSTAVGTAALVRGEASYQELSAQVDADLSQSSGALYIPTGETGQLLGRDGSAEPEGFGLIVSQARRPLCRPRGGLLFLCQ